MKKIVLSTRISEKLNKAIEEAKWSLRISKSQLVEKAITEYLKKHCPEVYEEFLKEGEGEGKG